MSWQAAAVFILGILLLKAIFDPDTEIYRCPYCSLVVKKDTSKCPRCHNQISW